MLNQQQFEELREQYLREKGLRERYDTLVRARSDLKSVDDGYHLNSILCHLPNDIVTKAKEYIEQLVQHEIDVLEK
jgi:hypothetical protein